jgi:MFS family permease
MERFGRKKTFAVCLTCTAILTFMQFFASSVGDLTASMYLSGTVWGSYCVIATTYASQVLPLRLRGFFYWLYQLMSCHGSVHPNGGNKRIYYSNGQVGV